MGGGRGGRIWEVFHQPIYWDSDGHLNPHSFPSLDISLFLYAILVVYCTWNIMTETCRGNQKLFWCWDVSECNFCWLSFQKFSKINRRPLCLIRRRRRWRWGWRSRGKAALLWRLHYAFLNHFLEGPLCFCTTYRLPGRMGLLHCLHFVDCNPDCCHWWLGFYVWVHN